MRAQEFTHIELGVEDVLRTTSTDSLEIDTELPGEIAGNARLERCLGELHRSIDPRRVASAADYSVVLREDGRQLVNRTFHQIAQDDSDTQFTDFGDVALLRRNIGFNGTGAQQDADLRAFDILGATGQVA
ncbi:hypothetical protein D3C80_1480750 [compost metagenome]